MNDPRYPSALDLTDEPEWETVEQERDYWKALANAYGAKLTALRTVMDRRYEARVNDQDGQVYVYEIVENDEQS